MYCWYFLNCVYWYQEQDYCDDWIVQGFNYIQDVWVQGGNNSGCYQYEQCSDMVQFVDFDRFIFIMQRFNYYIVEVFMCVQVVIEEGFGDSDNCDNWSYLCDNWCVKVVSQVRQN